MWKNWNFRSGEWVIAACLPSESWNCSSECQQKGESRERSWPVSFGLIILILWDFFFFFFYLNMVETKVSLFRFPKGLLQLCMCHQKPDSETSYLKKKSQFVLHSHEIKTAFEKGLDTSLPLTSLHPHLQWRCLKLDSYLKDTAGNIWIPRICFRMFLKFLEYLK